MGRPNEPRQQSASGEFSSAGEPLRGPVPPGSDQGFANRTGLGGPQSDIRRTAATPTALDRREDRGLGSDEQLLLLRGELDHAPAAAGIAERRENPARHAKVRVAHVSGFRGLWQTQGDASELTGGHGPHKLRARAATFKSFTAAELDAPLAPRYFSVPVSNARSDKGKPGETGGLNAHRDPASCNRYGWSIPGRLPVVRRIDPSPAAAAAFRLRRQLH